MESQKKKIKELERLIGRSIEIKNGKPYLSGSLDLRGTGITSLPEGLTVGGDLDLRGTGITSLPEGLTVGGDLIYKINDRDTTVYKQMSLDDELTFEEAIAAYRTITGACSAGTRDYIENRLPKPHKEKYTIREIIELTRGEYRSETFKQFFEK